MLENETIQGFVLGQYQAELRLGAISEDFMVEVDQTEPISVGIIFDAPPAYDGLRNCLRRRLFLHVLDNGALLQGKLAHRRDAQLTAYEAAENAFGGGDAARSLGIVAGVVVFVIIVVGVVDVVVVRYLENQQQQKKQQHQQQNCKLSNADETTTDNEAEVPTATAMSADKSSAR
jgi:hypothetical protein